MRRSFFFTSFLFVLRTFSRLCKDNIRRINETFTTRNSSSKFSVPPPSPLLQLWILLKSWFLFPFYYTQRIYNFLCIFLIRKLRKRCVYVDVYNSFTAHFSMLSRRFPAVAVLLFLVICDGVSCRCMLVFSLFHLNILLGKTCKRECCVMNAIQSTWNSPQKQTTTTMTTTFFWL